MNEFDPIKNMMERKVDEFVAITLLSAINFRTQEDLYDFMEIDNDYNFGICQTNIIELYTQEQEELFEEWHQIANELFLMKRMELINLLTEE